MDEHIFKWLFPCKFLRLENHPCYPEKDDVVASYECLSREVTFVIRRFCIRPAHSRERPKGGGEPCIKYIFILFPILMITRGFSSYIDFSCFFMVPGRNPVAPPQLSRNYPITNVFHPVEVRPFESFWEEIDFIVTVL